MTPAAPRILVPTQAAHGIMLFDSVACAEPAPRRANGAAP
jgi:hypothetical protein